MKNSVRKWNVGWGPVSLCNMNCKFCYSRTKRDEKQDLSYKDWIRFVDENHRLIKSINYGTGENSLSKEWFMLIDYVRNHYRTIRQSVTTNGYISKAIEDDPQKLEIVNRAVDEFDVSLDYADIKKHGEFRGQMNAGKWAIDTLNYCHKHNKEATIVCLGSRHNMYMENIDGIFDIAAQYGAKIRINIYRPTDGINEFTRQFIWDPHELVNILYSISEKYKVLAISDALFSNIMTDKSEVDPSGIDSIRILPDGSITPSTYLISDEYVIGNIRETNILESLSKRSALLNTIQEIIPKECRDCIYKNECKGGVMDRRYLWYGSLEKKDPYCVFDVAKMKKIHISDERFESVHYGYLPTMFFMPEKIIDNMSEDDKNLLKTEKKSTAIRCTEI